MPGDANLKVNQLRFLETFDRIASIGMDSSRAVSRLALGPADIRAREELMRELSLLNAEVKVDDAGNIYGLLPCGHTDSTIALGSHLDSVPQGGRFDGAYGVVAGLEILKTISERKASLKHNLLLIDFTNEEGARFTPGMAGSALATGRLAKEPLYNRADVDGVTFKVALDTSGFLGEEKNRIMHSPPAAYLELHIEQGPTLHQAGIDIGGVEGVQGIIWLEATVDGQANHAGTTPMGDRRDALIVAARTIVALREFSKSRPGLVVTVGRLEAEPNVINIIPGHTKFFIDIRCPSEAVLKEAAEYARACMHDITEHENTSLKVSEIETYQPTQFDQTVVRAIEEAASERGFTNKRMYSGAGHDAQNMATITKTGMIFIPSKNGISHSRYEDSSDDHLAKGINTLLQTVLNLDRIL